MSKRNKIILGVIVFALLVASGFLFVSRTNTPVTESQSFALKDKLNSQNIGGAGVTGYAYIDLTTLSQQSSKKGWYSWQGNDVVWIPFWREDDPKIAYKISGADLVTFRIFVSPFEDNLWAEDAHQVYYEYMPVPGVDLGTFVPDDSAYDYETHDAKTVYLIDPSTNVVTEKPFLAK